jgi:hypothetical protein
MPRVSSDPGGRPTGTRSPPSWPRQESGDVKGGTLYPLPARLEKNSLVSTEWRAGEGGPGRKYFALTEAGRTGLEQGIAQWRTFSATVTDYPSTGITGNAPQPPAPVLLEEDTMNTTPTPRYCPLMSGSARSCRPTGSGATASWWNCACSRFPGR